jgi:predicted lipoprotein with Yx(FWY)xxD motif
MLALSLLALAVGGCAQPTASTAFCYDQVSDCGYVRQTAAEPVVELRTGTGWGGILVTNQGYTLYRFARDARGVPRCDDGCAQRWPPLVLRPGQRLVAGSGVRSSDLAAVRRPDGARQVTYRGIPLYVYSMDQLPGDVNGQYVDDEGLWFVVTPSTRSPGEGPPPVRSSPMPAPAPSGAP